ncbi:MAG: radical SAM protein [Candidatus Bathyarchaeia archaeon]|nr:radical SAM protein [Candidatus Bathyarchaeota archaeon]
MEEKIQTFRLITNNFFTRSLLKSISSYCEKDEKNRLEVGLELYSGIRNDACLKCKIAEKFLNLILKIGRNAFNVSEEEMKRTFADTYWRRGLSSVVKGLGLFGVTKPFTPGAPFQVVWEITSACNLKCKHCSANAGVGSNELNTEEALKAIDELDKFGITILAFSGGEPLIRKDFLKLAKYAADKGIYVAVATNATLITREKAKEMKEAGIEYVQISLDGATPETHDSFRGAPGTFNRTIEGIKNVVAEDFFVNVSTTVTKLNYREVPKILDLCEKLGVDWFMAYNFIPTGRGVNISELDLTPEEREELLKMLYERMQKSNVAMLSTAPQFARVSLEASCQSEALILSHFYSAKSREKIKGLAEFIGGCGAGRFYIAIKPDGTIQPCVFLPLVLGNIKNDNLEELWVTSKILKDLRNKDILKGHCGICEYRYYCGGCRARAYGYFNDYLAPDPGCINNKAFYTMLKKGIELASVVSR